MPEPAAASRTVAGLVKERDRVRYWSTLFAPPDKQPHLLALYAFGAELAHIAAVAHEPFLAQIRLQWWRDAIEAAAPQEKTGNPVADALCSAILAHRLPRERLIGMTAGCILDPPAGAADVLPALRVALDDYEGTVFELAARVLGDAAGTAKQAARHAGIAYGLTERLRTAAALAPRQSLVLPAAYVQSTGAGTAWPPAVPPRVELGAAFGDLLHEAGEELARFREVSRGASGVIGQPFCRWRWFRLILGRWARVRPVP